MNKQELRQLYQIKRAEIHSKERLRLDDLLLLQFQQFDYSDVQTVLTYWPLANKSEPNTHLFSGYLRHMLPGMVLAYPLTDPLSLEMTALAIHEDTIYHTNAWGITEPKEGEVIDPTQIDLIFVPLLAYDTKGYRVGFGKGFYDRYLARCREDIVKIGFSYFGPVDEIADTDQFDVPLTYCITPQQTYEF
ncbi:MAG: 5-formyltetrahydrofolate cyclo-ligase [Sediminibacterium sp.]|nr:5-formyltetrahydrofolate cyclo-ligase [Sediminibacterium sp.]